MATDPTTPILYTSPRACSTACHLALAESGLDYRVEVVRIRRAEHRSESFLAMNPWGKVPVLVIGDEVLTETHAILSYVADSAGGNRLIGAEPLARARAHEWMNFISSTVHVAFRPLTRPAFFFEDRGLFPKLKEAGIPKLQQTLLEVDRRLTGRQWALGDLFSVVDPYLLVFWIWSQREDIRPHVPELPNWRMQAMRMFARPATWPALEREGITADNIGLP